VEGVVWTEELKQSNTFYIYEKPHQVVAYEPVLTEIKNWLHGPTGAIATRGSPTLPKLVHLSLGCAAVHRLTAVVLLQPTDTGHTRYMYLCCMVLLHSLGDMS
jgi:hypothetical protein